MIELSRRFSNGLWNCIQVGYLFSICSPIQRFSILPISILCMLQFWVCCGCTLALMNTICACLALPPILTPFTSVYLMCVIVPLISTTLVNNVADPEIMNRATGKKHSEFDSNVIVHAMCSYGLKFIPTIIIMVRFVLFKWKMYAF